RERVFVSGSVLSYAWLLGDKPIYKGDEKGREFAGALYGDKLGGKRNVRYNMEVLRASGDDFSVWGASHDALLKVGVYSRVDGYDAAYGADFSLVVPGGTGGSIVGYGRGATGSRVFFDTVYGNFSMGYQEGVETALKVDVLNSLPGAGNGSWGRHIMRFLKYSDAAPFHVYPGLYSENLFRSMAWKDASKDPFSVRFKDVVTTIPLRLSYVSKDINGFQFGVSYAVAGYRDDLFKGGDFQTSNVVSKIDSLDDQKAENPNVIAVRAISLGEPRFDLGPVYKNVLGAALRYELLSDDVKVALSFAIEHGDAKKHDKLSVSSTMSEGKFFIEYDELAAYSVGMEALYSGILKVGFNYGYLGKSGRPKTFTGRDSHGYIVRNVPYLNYRPSYYFASSLGYLWGSFSASVMCFVSKVGYTAPAAVASEPDLFSELKIVKEGGSKSEEFKSLFDGENVLTDFVLGFGYDMYRKGRANVQMFMNCHVFSSSQKFNVHKYLGVEDKSKQFEHVATHKNGYEGVMAFGGLKFTF
ncbi:hypothetical protein, partial [Anaplasma bovis]|uniref:hypothetical protein n=1 Tax=Anaplasma bovis TaxID=186733 RepID=UPI002FF39D41